MCFYYLPAFATAFAARPWRTPFAELSRGFRAWRFGFRGGFPTWTRILNPFMEVFDAAHMMFLTNRGTPDYYFPYTQIRAVAHIDTYSVRLKLAPLYKRTGSHHCKSKKVDSDLGCFGLIFFPSIFFSSDILYDGRFPFGSLPTKIGTLPPRKK